MGPVSGLPPAAQVAVTQSQIQTEVSLRVHKLAKEMGQNMLEIVQQTAEAIEQTNSAKNGGLDLYA